MKQKIVRSTLLLAMSLLLVAALFLLLFFFDNKYTTRLPLSQAGHVSLPEDLLSSESTAFLIEGWELYPDQLLSPEQIQANNGQPVYTFVGQYLNLSPLHADASPYGTATYRLVFDYHGPSGSGVLLFPEIYCAYTVYINGEKMAARGSVDPYQPHVQDMMVSFPLQPSNEIVVQIANYTHYYSGITFPPAIGSAQAIGELVTNRLIFYSFLTFFSLAGALLSLALWLKAVHKTLHDRLALYFGALCLSFSIWVGYPLVRFWGVPLVRTLYAVEDTAFLSLLFFSLLIVLQLCRQRNTKRGKLLCKIFLSATICGTILPLFVLPAFPAFHLVYGKIVTLYTLLAALSLLLLSLFGSLKGFVHSSWMLSGCAFFGGTLLIESLTVSQFEPARFSWMQEYGAFGLVLCFGILMVQRNYALVMENQRLTEHLQTEVEKKTRDISVLVRERDELLSSFLHDMKSPVSFMLSYVQMVRLNNIQLDDQTRDQLAILEEKCSDITSRMHKMQQYTVENPLLTSKKRVDLIDFLSEFYRFNQPDVEMDGQTFSLQINCTSPCVISADEDQLSRLLQNLVYNAVSFTPLDGKITLSLSQDDQFAQLEVDDTGCGIPPENLPRLFDRFFTTRAQDGGTGLGLYIVHTIVQEHGGKITVHSKVGKGTRFTILFPLCR